MSWATSYIAKLKAGEAVSFRPRGHSMKGKIASGQLVTVEPLAEGVTPAVGDVVLCTVRGAQYLHLVKAVRGAQFLIGNNVGGTNGWIAARAIYGRCVRVED